MKGIRKNHFYPFHLWLNRNYRILSSDINFALFAVEMNVCTKQNLFYMKGGKQNWRKVTFENCRMLLVRTVSA